MTPDEVVEFEGLLGESQPAREAVAAAVVLSETVVVAAKGDAPNEESKPVHRPVGRAMTWRQRLVWASIGAAASLVLAWGLAI